MRTVVLPPPPPRVHMPAWTPAEQRRWVAHAARASDLSRGPGTGRNFAALVAEARALLLASDGTALSARLGDHRFVRAVATAWVDDAALARYTMSPELVAHLTGARISRLTTTTLATFWFTHFDQLDGWRSGLFASVRDLVRVAVAQQPVRTTATDLVESVRRHDAVLLRRRGPRRLAATLLSSGGDVTSWFRSAGLGALADTRLGRIARDEFYLAQIEAADPEVDDHPFLATVSSEAVARQGTDAEGADGRLFGHAVLTALTAKTTRRPGDEWLGAVLAVAGDPRNTRSGGWATWWSRIPPENRDRAVRWMQGVDLRAFLDGVEDYARATSNADLSRMLERRKRLLVGLHEQDLVRDVRLVLGDDIRQWIRRSAPFDLRDVARLQDPGKHDTAVVYVDCGDFSLVEGSHNFKLHLFVGGPVGPLADRRVTSFDGAFLRDTLRARHEATHGLGSSLALSHLGFEWVRRALDFLAENGIRVDETTLMTGDDHEELERRRAPGT